MLGTVRSPPLSSSSLQERNARFAVRFTKLSLVVNTRRNLPSIRAATNSTGFHTELDAVARFSEIVPDTVVFDDFDRVDYIISPLKILQSLKESVTPPDEKYSLVRRLSPQSAISYIFKDDELVKWDQYSFASALGPAAIELLTAGMDGYANQSKRVEYISTKSLSKDVQFY